MNEDQLRMGFGTGLFLLQIGIVLLVISVLIPLTNLGLSFIGLGLTIFLYFKGNPKDKSGYLGKWTDIFNPFKNPLFNKIKKPKWLTWENANKPLSVVGILFIVGFILFFTLGQKEKVICNFMVHPKQEYIRTQWNFSDNEIASFINFYRKPFRANLTFDSYQEAWAFKQLWIDGQKHYEWYYPTLDCDEDKIQLPIEFNDAVLNNIGNNK